VNTLGSRPSAAGWKRRAPCRPKRLRPTDGAAASATLVGKRCQAHHVAALDGGLRLVVVPNTGRSRSGDDWPETGRLRWFVITPPLPCRPVVAVIHITRKVQFVSVALHSA